MKRMLNYLLLAAALVLFPVLVQAHEFILKPDQLSLKGQKEVPFSVISAHVFMVSEEMEPAEHVSVALHSGSAATSVAVVPNESAMTLEGRAPIEGDGAAILAGHREGMIWTQTTKGWKQASKKGLDGVIKSGKYEKFCKSVITGATSKGFDKVVGQRLEIVPLDDPASLKTGDEMRVKVLFDGKPVSSGALTATYDGFSQVPNTWAYLTETYEKDVARIKIDAPGVWMVRAQQTIDEPTEDYDTHVIRSVLVFEVK